MSTASPPQSERACRLMGTTLGERYKVLSMLGEGAMGEVFLVEDTSTHQRMALKLLSDEMGKNPEAVARFEREALAAANIHHPNVAAAIDSGRTSDGALFVVYEYAAGHSLYDRVVQGRLPATLALHITRQVASALVWAHAIGVVHRDIKAENIVLVPGDGDEVTAKVLDFGVAKVSSELLREGTAGVHQSIVLTRMGTTLGTPAYMAPEQAIGAEVDGRSDLYSLGVLLYEMVTGSLPFECPEPSELLRLHLIAPVPPLGSRVPGLQLPLGLEAMVLKLLEKEPELRFQSAKELIAAIDELVHTA
jgi:serine/threonine protein kinase